MLYNPSYEDDIRCVISDRCSKTEIKKNSTTFINYSEHFVGSCDKIIAKISINNIDDSIQKKIYKQFSFLKFKMLWRNNEFVIVFYFHRHALSFFPLFFSIDWQQSVQNQCICEPRRATLALQLTILTIIVILIQKKNHRIFFQSDYVTEHDDVKPKKLS